jgi:Helix-turn-helix domain
MTDQVLESFVDAARAAEFLAVKPRWLLDLARAGKIPAHPIGDGARRVWRFRLSEIAAAVAKIVFTSPDDAGIRNPSVCQRRGV